MSKMKFWGSGFGKAIRWVIFLPIGFIGGALLQGIPPVVFQAAAETKVELTCLALLAAAFVVSIGAGIVYFWAVGVFMAAMFPCRFIAPHPQIGSVVFLTLFLPLQGFFFLSMISEQRWLLTLYHLVYTGIFVAGAVSAYRSDDSEDRLFEGSKLDELP